MLKRKNIVVCMLMTAGCLWMIFFIILLEDKVLNPGDRFRDEYALSDDIEYFPVARSTNDSTPYVYYENSWGDARTYGGERKHEGIDILAIENISGKYPVVSMTDGIVENKGWLELGGYRVGIRSKNGGYFYYAHLDSYADDIIEGGRVRAGQLLGYMGNTGYGPEGTTGMFDVHLHIGIYITNKNGEEKSINPFPYLNEISKKTIKYKY